MKWLKTIFLTIFPPIKVWGGHIQIGTKSRLATSSRNKLMKDRPESWNDDFEVSKDREQVLKKFKKLSKSLFEEFKGVNEKSNLGTWRESGHFNTDRGYFFVQPFNCSGFLFEEVESGWQLSLAEKIVRQGTFVKSSQVIDHVRVYKNEAGLTRVSSEWMGMDKVSMSVYQQRFNKLMTEYHAGSGS